MQAAQRTTQHNIDSSDSSKNFYVPLLHLLPVTSYYHHFDKNADHYIMINHRNEQGSGIEV